MTRASDPHGVRAAEIRAELAQVEAELWATDQAARQLGRYRLRTYAAFLAGAEGGDRIARRWEAYLCAAGESDRPQDGQHQSILVELFDGATNVGVIAVFYKGRLIWESE